MRIKKRKINATSMFGEEEGFFTKDDIMELAEQVESGLQELWRDGESDWATDGQYFRYTDVYIDGNVVNIDITAPDGNEYGVSALIDMRKIRRPSDILKYTDILINRFVDQYTGEDIGASINCADDITSIDLDEYEFVDNRDGYLIYRKIVDGKGVWVAQDQDELHPPFSITYDQARGYEPIDKYDDNAKKLGRMVGKALFGADEFDKYEDDIKEIDQEFTSENTSINKGKLPAIFKMVSFEPGTTNIDYGGGKFDNVADYLTQYDVINLVYDPYNRSQEHNREVIKTIKNAGGADTATCSNVLNVIKEPEVRRNVLENMKKLVKPGGDIYITVYEGSGRGDEGPTKSGYQLNRKTADYLDEIKEVFPDAIRKGKLIKATNSGSANSSTEIKASTEGVKSLEDELYRAGIEFMTSPDIGFTDDEAKEYFWVEVTAESDHTRAEVGAELSYDSMMELSSVLDAIVKRYDEDAYFEMEEPGLMSCYMWNITASTNITSAEYIPERSLTPPEYDDLIEEDSYKTEVEVHVDDIVIVDDDSYWTFENDECLWASIGDKNHNVYDEENYVYITDEGGIIEDCVDLLYTYVPAQPGRYHIEADITLVYEISGMLSESRYLGSDEDGDPVLDEEIYKDDAEATFKPKESTVQNFTFEEV